MPAKQAINDNLQGSAARYSRCGGDFNSHIKEDLLLSLWVKKTFKIGEYLAKLQARTWLSRVLSPSFSSVLAKRRLGGRKGIWPHL